MQTTAEASRLVIPTPQSLAGLPKDTPILLALSGGADSRALLHLLSKQAVREGYSLTLAHVNHGIRGEEALRDAAFCRRLAGEYGLEICILDTDVPTLAKAHGTGLEEEARRQRYAYFARLMQERSIPLLVTAHHADDQLETLLFRLCRGSGPRGLGGMAALRRLEYGQVVRPMLGIPRRDILAYCQAEGLEYVTDSTNSDTAYARNRIRAEIVPVMEALFDAPQKRAAALAEDLREDEAYLSSIADAMVDGSADGRLPIERIATAPRPIARRALMRWCERTTGRIPERVHVDAVQSMIARKDLSCEVALAGGYAARIENGYLVASPDKRSRVSFEVAFCEGVTEIPEAGLRISVEKASETTKINNLSTQSGIIYRLHFGIIKGNLVWRPMREGDRLLLGGMHRRVRRLFREKGLTPRQRQRIPLLCDGDGIVLAPYVGVRDGLDRSGDAYLIKIEQFEVKT